MSFRFRNEQITVIGRGYLLIESWTYPGEYHTVDTEDMTCSCRGFNCRKKCRHLDKIKELLKYMEDMNGTSGKADSQ